VEGTLTVGYSLTAVRIHAHKHHTGDHFRAVLGNFDFTHFSRESEKAVSAIAFNTSRDGGTEKDLKSKTVCKCGLINHVGRNDPEKEAIDMKYLSRAAKLETSPFNTNHAGGGITKVVVGFVTGSFRIAALTLFSGDGMKGKSCLPNVCVEQKEN
jgi:hypothetical protein